MKQFCIMQTFPNDISRFANWKSCFTFCMNWSKEVVTSLDGINGRSTSNEESWAIHMLVLKRKEINQGRCKRGNFSTEIWTLLSEWACRPGVCWWVAQCVQNGVYKKREAFDTLISAWNELKCNVKSNCFPLSWLSRIFRPLDDCQFHTSRGWTRYKSYKRGP